VSEEARKVQRRLDDIRTMLAHKSPIDYFILKGISVYYDDRFGGTGYTDGRSIYLGKMWMGQEDVQCLVTLVHEIGHVKLLHPFRLKHESDLARIKVLQLAMDLKVNYHIKQLGLRPKVEPEQFFNRDDLVKCSAEELADRLVNEGKVQIISVPLEAGMDCSGCSDNGDGDDSSKSYNGTMVQKGEKDLQTSDDVKDLVKQSLLAAKVAGQDLGALDKMILDKLLKSKVDWRAVLRRMLHNYLAKNAIGTWRKLNRKMRDFPGREMISKPRVWVFVDVSGSISEREFEQFISEIVRIMDFVEEVRVITWNVGVCEDRVIKKKSDVLVNWEKGGGTMFKPVWDEYKNKMKRQDLMVVLTDGEWFDDEGFMVKGGAGRKIMVTTHRGREGFEVIKIEGDERW